MIGVKTIIIRIELCINKNFEISLGNISNGRFEETEPVPALQQEEEWLDNRKVMDLLCISESTFYRRRNECNWAYEMIGRRKYYRKSAIFPVR